MKRIFTLLAFIGLAVTGCTLAPNYQQPAAPSRRLFRKIPRKKIPATRPTPSPTSAGANFSTTRVCSSSSASP
jgi:quinol-cytochrome oxidoreductase complex cytochrome b subunit